MPKSNLPPAAPPGEPASTDAETRASARRSDSTQTILAPRVSQALPLLADESAFTLPLSLQDQPLEVVIDTVWPVNEASVAMTTLVEYLWQNVVVYTDTITGPYDPNVVFPFVRYLPAHILTTGGIRQLRYRVSALLITTTLSFPTLVNVDKTKPNNNNPLPPLIFDPDVIAGGVSDDYLVLHGGVVAEVVHWPDIHIEDRVEFFWGPVANVNLAGTLEIDATHTAGGAITYLIDEAFIRARGPGPQFVSYQLTDRAGNITSFSTAVELQVNLITLPDVTRPDVPLSEIDGLIDLDDVRTGVFISIPEIIGALPGDEILLFWNIHPLPLITVGAVQTWPMTSQVQWPILAAGGFAGRYPVRVRYIFRRGTATKNSPDNFFEADFSVAGPNPTGPGPIHNLLSLPVVKGAMGDDVVTQSDAPGPVRVEVLLYANPVPGHRLELYWGSDAAFADDYEIQPGDAGGTTAVFWVPWVLILGGASGQVPVYYWTDNHVNRQRSPAKSVRVELDTLKGLVAPTLLNNSPRDYIACDTKPEPWTGVFIGIPWDATHFEVDDTVRLYWSSYPTTNGRGDPFPGTSVEFDLTLTDAHRIIGHAEVQISPFNPLLTQPGLVRPNGSGVAYYRLFKASGPSGVSPKKLLFIDLIRNDGMTCFGPTSNS